MHSIAPYNGDTVVDRTHSAWHRSCVSIDPPERDPYFNQSSIPPYYKEIFEQAQNLNIINSTDAYAYGAAYRYDFAGACHEILASLESVPPSQDRDELLELLILVVDERPLEVGK